MEKKTKLFYLKKKVLFPHCTLDVTLRQSKISDSLKAGDQIIALPINRFFDFLRLRSRLSTLAEITEIENDDKFTKLRLKGIKRVKLEKVIKFHNATYSLVDNTKKVLDEKTKELKLMAQQLIFLINVNESDRLIELINILVDPDQITDFISNYFILDFKSRLKLFLEIDSEKRCNLLIDKMKLLIEKIESTG